MAHNDTLNTEQASNANPEEEEPWLKPIHLDVVRNDFIRLYNLIMANPEILFEPTNSIGKLQPLDIAVMENNIIMVKFLLDLGATINYEDALGNSPLSSAIKANALELAIQLLKLGANLNQKNPRDETPLFFAKKLRDCEFVEDLLNYKGKTPFVIDSLKGKTDFAKFLLESENSAYKDETLFVIACLEGETDVAEFLLEIEANIKVDTIFRPKWRI